MVRNIVLAGVGGQGLITMGRIIGEALLSKGYNVMVSEVHGLSQRGGSVVIYLKYGKERGISPIIPKGYAEVEIALELIEGLRYSYLLSKNGTMLVNDFILPPPGIRDIPTRDELLSTIESLGVRHFLVEASSIAQNIGNPLLANMVLTGVAGGLRLLPLTLKDLEVGVRRVLKERFQDTNIKAIKLGYQEGQKMAFNKADIKGEYI